MVLISTRFFSGCNHVQIKQSGIVKMFSMPISIGIKFIHLIEVRNKHSRHKHLDSDSRVIIAKSFTIVVVVKISRERSTC